MRELNILTKKVIFLNKLTSGISLEIKFNKGYKYNNLLFNIKSNILAFPYFSFQRILFQKINAKPERFSDQKCKT